MHHFVYRDKLLYCENVPVKEIAARVGTPFYLYSHQTLIDHYRKIDSAFKDIPHLICYSVKANSNLAILNVLKREGSGADIVSGGELYRSLRAGIPPEKIVFAGIGKTEPEMEYALRSDILMFNVESSQELALLSEVATRLGKTARIALRVNPDVDPKTHPYIATGLSEAKFGIGSDEAIKEYQAAASLPGIQIVGIHQHIGSQITQVTPFQESLEKIANLVKYLKGMGIDIHFLNIGGGFGIPYRGEEVPVPIDYAQALTPLIRATGCTGILEIGRMIVGNAGILVSRVLYRKSTERKKFLIVDAAMNDLIRPSLYGSYHEILPVEKNDRELEKVDVVGPVCESGDFLAKDRELPMLQPGELLAVMSAGAYGFTMSSNYNSRLRAAEVMVKEDQYYVVREREKLEDLIKGEERIP